MTGSTSATEMVVGVGLGAISAKRDSTNGKKATEEVKAPGATIPTATDQAKVQEKDEAKEKASANARPPQEKSEPVNPTEANNNSAPAPELGVRQAVIQNSPKQKVQPTAPTVPVAPLTLFPISTAELTKSTTPVKRPAAINVPDTLALKRTKLSPNIPGSASLVPSSTLPTKGHLTPSHIIEARRRLEEIKAKRQDTARLQCDIDTQSEPYQKKLQEEIDQINREMEEQERLHEEEQQRLSESTDWLKQQQAADTES